MQVKATELATTIDVCILTFNGLSDMLALPDSGADISATCPQLIKLFNVHNLNLYPQRSPHRLSVATRCKPWSKLNSAVEGSQ